jgi:DNA polymerase-3 subunit gamma/tau
VDEDDEVFEAEPYDVQDGPDLFDSDEPEVADLPADAGSARSRRSEEEVTASLMEVVDALREPASEIVRPETPLALYRRYRPDTFAQVIGQEHVTEPLQRALVNNRVNHAYLFSGPRGCGKTTSARILARCLNCAEGPTPTPCGVCQSCRDLARGGVGSIDVIEIDAASHGGVNEARDLRERAFFAPVHSRYKVYIIDEAHMVTKEGFNALLKVVEEPPPHVKFIFATTEPDKVLGTIRSRTHHYPFRLVPPKTLSAYLAELCQAEGIAVEPTVLPLVVRAGAGSVRDSLSVLDQLLGGASEGGVTYRQATALLGYTPDALLDEIIDAFAAGDAQGVFATVEKVIEIGQDPRRFAEDLLRRLRDLIVVSAVPEALSSGLVDVSGDQGERLVAQADTMGAGELTRAAEVIAVGLTEMRGTTAPRLHLELMCARVLLPGADLDERGLHARLDRLERRLSIVDAGSEPAPTTASAPKAASSAKPRATTSAAPAPSAAESVAQAKAAAKAARSPQAEAPASDPWAASTPADQSAPAKTRPTPSGEPGPAPVEPVAEVADAPTPAAAPAPPPADPGALSTADLRRLWPQVLEEVKNRRRFTWILLSQNSSVVELREGVLTLGLANPGARESFGKGGSSDVLREAILAVIGAAVRIETVVDATADAPARPAAAAAPTAEPVARSAAAEQARQEIRPTRSASSPASAEPTEDEPDRDDAELVEDDNSGEELLMKHLGAELIDPS